MSIDQHYGVNSSEGNSTIVVIRDGGAEIVTAEHPNYVRIVQALSIPDYFAAAMWLDDAIDYDATGFDADLAEANIDLPAEEIEAVIEGLEATIARYRREERDVTNLVRFAGLLSLNPSENSRAQIFNWTQAKEMTIDEDGFIIGFKGVRTRTTDQDHLGEAGEVLFPLSKYPYESGSRGHGVVDGIEVNGHLPMGVGVTVEMPRDEVQDDPSRGCSSGLHVGTYGYAKGYARGALLEVRFSPADVVSVPSDSGFAKLRCCKYTGIAIHEAEGDLTSHEPAAGFVEDDVIDALESEKPGFWKRVMARRKNKGES